MSLTLVRPYFRERIKSVDADFKEHTDGFNFENIGRSGFDKAFHIESGTIAGESINQDDQRSNSEITIRIFLKGFRDPQKRIDDAILISENILKAVLKTDQRLGAGVKNVVWNNTEIKPFSEGNDNAVILEMNFTAFVIIAV